MLSTWLPDGSMVDNGATVFWSMFMSMVGSAVAVSIAAVPVLEEGSNVGVGGSVPVGVQGTGWKGVRVGVAFGAAVTNTKGRDDCAGAGARVPHPARRSAASRMTCAVLFMGQDDGLGGVFEGVNVGAVVGVDVGVPVGGTNVSVGTTVFVLVAVAVAVGKLGMMVVPGIGVRVGTLGTQSNCPA